VVGVDGRQHGGGDLLRVAAVAGVDPLQEGEPLGHAVGVAEQDWHEPLAQLHGSLVLASALGRPHPVRAQAAHHGVGRLDGRAQLGPPRRRGRDVVGVHPQRASPSLGGPDNCQHRGGVPAGVGHERVKTRPLLDRGAGCDSSPQAHPPSCSSLLHRGCAPSRPPVNDVPPNGAEGHRPPVTTGTAAPRPSRHLRDVRPRERKDQSCRIALAAVRSTHPTLVSSPPA
jgi:hypothetical protein